MPTPQCALQTSPTIKAAQQAHCLDLRHIYTAQPGTEWLQASIWLVGLKVHAPSFGAHVHMTTHAAFLQRLQASGSFPSSIVRPFGKPLKCRQG